MPRSGSPWLGFLAVATGLLIWTPAHAQCTPSAQPEFQVGPTDNLGGAVGSSVTAMVQFDDGSGPALFAGGYFPRFPPATSERHVAKFQHGVWAALPALPVNPGSGVRALAVADFSSLQGPGPSLYAAGEGGVIARWTGSSWSSITLPCVAIYSLVSWSDASGPVLLAGGPCNTIWGWRGIGPWTPYGAPLASGYQIYGLTIVDDGTGPAPFALAQAIFKFADGAWSLYTHPNVPGIRRYSSLISFDDGTGPALFLTGDFGEAQGNVARLRNGQWDRPSGFTLQPVTVGPFFFKIDEGNGVQLYVGGRIIPQPEGAAGLLRWNGTGWNAPIATYSDPMFPYGAVLSMIRHDDGDGPRTYFGGAVASATVTPAPPQPWLPVPAIGVMASNHVESIARGLGNPLNAAAHYGLSVLDLGAGPRLICAGSFLRAGGFFSVGAAAFNGAGWSPLSAPTATFQFITSPIAAVLAGQTRLVANVRGSVMYWDGLQWVSFASQPGGPPRSSP